MLTPRLLIILCLLSAGTIKAQFVAFWDHVPGTNDSQTHTNTTVTNISPSFFRMRTIALKNITNGLTTPVSLSMTNVPLASGYTVSGTSICTNPAPGTPLYNCFYYTTTNPVTHQPTNCSYVCFGRSSNVSNIQVTNAAIHYIFTGLNPNARYSFQGGTVGGGDTNSEMRTRWTQVELAGTADYVPRMTSHVLTFAHTPDLAPNQVAVNFACNQTPDTGDMVDWENIAPASDGSFRIICSRYAGAAPGGSSSGGQAFVITGFRLEEYFPPRLDIAGQAGGNFRLSWSPTNGNLVESTNLTQWQPSTLTNGASGRSMGQRYFRLTQ